MDYNALTVTGHVTADGQLKTIPSGIKCLDFTVANNGYNDSVTFFKCSYFGKVAESVAPYVQKGTHVLVVGECKLNTWESKVDQQVHSQITINVSKLTLLGRPQNAPMVPPPEVKAEVADDEDIQF